MVAGELPISPDVCSDILINCFYCNAQSLKNKLAELHDTIYSGIYSVYCFSESWLNPLVTDGMLDPQSKFSIYRKDRCGKSGGGVVILVSCALKSSPVNIDYCVCPLLELVGCTLKCNKVPTYMFCYYCPPNVTFDVFKHSLDYFKSLCLSKSCVIFGDFNLPSINWLAPYDCKEPKLRVFIEFCSDVGLDQMNMYPTRYNNLLDLVLTNDQLLISSLSVGVPFSTSDHNSISVSVILPQCVDNKGCVINDSEVKVRNWSEANWTAYSQYLY